MFTRPNFHVPLFLTIIERIRSITREIKSYITLKSEHTEAATRGVL